MPAVSNNPQQSGEDLQTAINTYAKNAQVPVTFALGAGQYELSSGFTVPSNVTIEGVSSYRTTLTLQRGGLTMNVNSSLHNIDLQVPGMIFVNFNSSKKSVVFSHVRLTGGNTIKMAGYGLLILSGFSQKGAEIFPPATTGKPSLYIKHSLINQLSWPSYNMGGVSILDSLFMGTSCNSLRTNKLFDVYANTGSGLGICPAS